MRFLGYLLLICFLFINIRSICQESFVIEGAMTIDDVSDINNVTAGTIRWTGTDFEGFDGVSWYSLTGKTNITKQVGDLHQGGIVFYTYDNGNHGLIASLYDLDEGLGIEWASVAKRYKLTTADDFYDGVSNTTEIIDSIGIGDYAAMRCDTFSADGFMDWYLPSKRELDLLVANDVAINMSLNANGHSSDAYIKSTGVNNGTATIYWSSTEHNSSEAHHSRLDVGFYYITSGYKDEKARVRCIRKF
jgi:hypothetical protein